MASAIDCIRPVKILHGLVDDVVKTGGSTQDREERLTKRKGEGSRGKKGCKVESAKVVAISHCLVRGSESEWEKGENEEKKGV